MAVKLHSLTMPRLRWTSTRPPNTAPSIREPPPSQPKSPIVAQGFCIFNSSASHSTFDHGWAVHAPKPCAKKGALAPTLFSTPVLERNPFCLHSINEPLNVLQKRLRFVKRREMSALFQPSQPLPPPSTSKHPVEIVQYLHSHASCKTPNYLETNAPTTTSPPSAPHPDTKSTRAASTLSAVETAASPRPYPGEPQTRRLGTPTARGHMTWCTSTMIPAAGWRRVSVSSLQRTWSRSCVFHSCQSPTSPSSPTRELESRGRHSPCEQSKRIRHQHQPDCPWLGTLLEHVPASRRKKLVGADNCRVLDGRHQQVRDCGLFGRGGN